MSEHDHGLYRRPKSKYWWMSFYSPDANGRAVKVQQSTKETSKAKARKARKSFFVASSRWGLSLILPITLLGIPKQ